MALGTPAVLAEAGGGGIADTTDDFTPDPGDLVLVQGSSRAGSSVPGAPTISDNTSGAYAWVLAAERLDDVGSGIRIRQRVWGARAPATTAPMTVTVGSSGAGKTQVAVYRVPGARLKFTNVADAVSGSGDPAIVMPSEPAADSGVIGFCAMAGTGAITPPSGFVELSDYATNTDLRTEVAYDFSSPPSSFAWASTNGPRCCAVALEIEALQSYVLTLQPAAVAIAGQALQLKAQRRLILQAAAAAIAGQALQLKAQRRLILQPTAVAIAGQTLQLKAQRRLALEPAAVAIAGQTLALQLTRRLVLQAAAVAIAGQALQLKAQRRLALEPAAVAIAGQAFGLARAYILSLQPAAVAIAGQALQLKAQRRLALGPAALAIAGQAMMVRAQRRLVLQSAAVTVTGQAMVLRVQRRLVLQAVAVAIAGQALQLKAQRRLVLQPGGVAIAGQALGLRARRRLVLQPTAVAIAGQALELRLTRRLVLEPAAVAIAPGQLALVYHQLQLGGDLVELQGHLDIVAELHGSLGVEELEGRLGIVAELLGGGWPHDIGEGRTLLTRQNVRIDKGGGKRLRFTVPGGAGATAANWYCAATRNTIAADRDLALSSGDGALTLEDQGDDLVVTVFLTPVHTEELPAGTRFHQLFIVDSGGTPDAVAEGDARVFDSLRN